MADAQSEIGCRGGIAMDDLDKNIFWTGIVYFVGFILLHVSWWQALMAAVVMAVCWFLSYGQRFIRTVGVFVLLLGFCTWTGLVPQPAHWPQVLAAIR